MEDWNYTYGPSSKAEWLRQIETDLKNASIDSIQAEWWPGEILSPAHHAEDLDGDPIILPNKLFDLPPKIIEWIDTSNIEVGEVNNKILNALQFGAESLIFTGFQKRLMFFDVWLRDVERELIEINVQIDAPNEVEFENIPKVCLIRIVRDQKSSSEFCERIISVASDRSESIRIIYEIPVSGMWTKTTSGIFQSILDDLKYWTTTGRNKTMFIKKCILMIKPDTGFFKQVIQIRVIHLVWNNLLHSMNLSGLTSNQYLECHVVPNKNQNPDQYLIRASANALGASLTGVHGLCIHHLETPGIPDYYMRIGRNVHHLLSLESEIYKGSDPLGGSYAFDFYARKWTKEIWNAIQKRPRLLGLDAS